jgi:plastocyanin
MAFSSIIIKQGKKQLHGLFNEMFTASGTQDFGSVAAAAETVTTMTVPGVALGDMILSWSVDVDNDAAATAMWSVYVSAADTVSFAFSNTHASTAINLASSTYKVVIGRPSF